MDKTISYCNYKKDLNKKINDTYYVTVIFNKQLKFNTKNINKKSIDYVVNNILINVLIMFLFCRCKNTYV